MVSKDEVKYIAEIAKLEISQSEIDSFTQKFDQVMDFMEKINEVDTEGIEPTYSVLEDDGFMKHEENNQTLKRDEAIMNTKETKYGYFKILRVVE